MSFISEALDLLKEQEKTSILLNYKNKNIREDYSIDKNIELQINNMVVGKAIIRDYQDGEIFLSDFVIFPEFRGKGYGKALPQKLAAIAVERGCGRLEWWCLDWNRPSIDFYKSLGAEPMSDWTVYRLAGDTLKRAAE
mgnify:CR=1 FL=1